MSRQLLDLELAYRRASGWLGDVFFAMAEADFVHFADEVAERNLTVVFSDGAPGGQVFCLPVDE